MRVGAALLIKSISFAISMFRFPGPFPALFVLAADRHEKEKNFNER